MTLDEFRAALPAATTHRFLNYAATAPLFKPSAERMAQIAEQATEPMTKHFNAWLSLFESVRRSVADLISASPEEIAFVSNTSTGLSLIAGAIRWRVGDRVLYPADEFSSNRYVWQNLADVGVIAQPIALETGVEFAEQLERRDLDAVRLVALSAVAYHDGRRHDIDRVVRLCHARGILVAVDGIQAVGAIVTDVRRWGCDFLACGGQKWLLGPVGSGFLYIARDRLPELHVPLVGWASSRAAGDFEVERLEFCDGARRFEPGLPDIAVIAGLGASLELLATAGWLTIFSRIAQHRARLGRELSALGLPVVHDGPPETTAGIVTVILPDDATAEAVGQACERARIILTQRRRHVRIAAHATTSDEDIQAVLQVLAKHAPRGRAQSAVIRPVREESDSEVPKTPLTPRGRWRLAIVTGASRGLGEGIAQALAKRGCGVILIGRDLVALQAVANRLQSEYGVLAEPVDLDLSDRPRVAQWVRNQQERLWTCDVLVNNAVQGEAAPFLELNVAQLGEAFTTNVFTPMILVQATLPGMLERRSGAILNIVNTTARCGMPLFSGYAASKGALWAWSESLTRELAGTGVTVTTFLPPHMSTTTQRNLARNALSYYALPRTAEHLAAPTTVGEQAIAALAVGRATVIPWNARVKLIANILMPSSVSQALRKSWKGQRRRQ